MDNKWSLILLSLVLSLSCLSQPSLAKAESPSALMNILLSIDNRGHAEVLMNITFPSSRNFNLTIPKTAENLSFEQNRESRVIELNTSYDHLEITPRDFRNLTLTFSWPDCAVSYNEKYYVGSSSILGIFPNLIDVDTNISLIVPNDWNLEYNTTNREFQISSLNNATFIELESYSKRGNLQYIKYLPKFVFNCSTYFDNRETQTSANVQIEYPTQLDVYIPKILLMSQDTYSWINNRFSTRSSNQTLKINFVPQLFIENDRGNVGGFYRSVEDSIYLPLRGSYDIDGFFDIYFEGYSIQSLHHEIVHSFTSTLNLPTFLEEGIAEYTTLRILNETNYNSYYERKRQSLENPLDAKSFQAQNFFNWSIDATELKYSQMFFMAYLIANETTPSVFEDLVNRIDRDECDFSKIQILTDRFDLLLYYLKQVSTKDLTSLFFQHGLVTHLGKL
ncbi:MAG: hypothetical protein ACW99Q_28405, partial [Candidatus Kariarchaeaceae archaeon]